MSSTPASNEMLRYFLQLNNEEQASIVNTLRTFVSARHTSENSSAIHEYNQELDSADAEIEAGDYVDHKAVMKKYLGA